MSIVIDSLRVSDSCETPASSNDSCRIEAGFHLLNPSSSGPQVQPMWETDRIVLRRTLFRGPGGDQRVRFVVEDDPRFATVRSIVRDQRFDGAGDEFQSALDRAFILFRQVRGWAQYFRAQNAPIN